MLRGDQVDRAARLRLDGHPYRRIGAEMGLSARGAWLLVQRAIDAGSSYSDQLRAQELGQLDERAAAITQRRAVLVGATQEGSE